MKQFSFQIENLMRFRLQKGGHLVWPHYVKFHTIRASRDYFLDNLAFKVIQGDSELYVWSNNQEIRM